MSRMFFNCSSLKEINLSNFNYNNVTDMSRMFFGYSSLKEINLSKFKTSNETNMILMFYNCSSLKEIIPNPQSPLTKFPIQKLIN